MQNLLEMAVRSHEAWQKSDFYHKYVFEYAYAPLTLDLDLFPSNTMQASSVLMSEKQLTVYWQFTFYRL